MFSAAGGLSLGLERAGFRSVFALDTNTDAIATYRNRFNGVATEERRSLDTISSNGVVSTW
ncbi:MAG: DNA cytosine methyltransferase [Pseudomonadota bacterium]